jgi:osomolarity two-component system, sensor histidine kinase CHK1
LTSGNSFNDVRPSLGRLDSTGSIGSSSTDDSRRKASGLTTTSTARDSDISSELDLQSVMRASLAIQEGAHVQNIILKLVRIIMQTAGANYGVVMLREQNLEKKMLFVEVIGEGNKISLVDHKPLQSQKDVVPTRLCEYVPSFPGMLTRL